MFTGPETGPTPPSPAQRCIVATLVAFGALATGYALIALALPLGPGFTSLNGPTAGGDSVMMIASARIAAGPEPALAYDRSAFQATVQTIAPRLAGEAAWPYPPTMLVLTRPLGGLSAPAALAAWLALLIVAAGAAAAVVARRPAAAAVGIASPAAAATVATGQFSAIGAFGVAAFVRFFDRDARLAGLALGLLGIKPQLAIAAGTLALLERRWRLLAWAIGAQLALVGASVAMFGPAMWPAFAAAGRRQSDYLLAGRVAPGRTVAVFAQLVDRGAPVALAAAVAVPVAIGAIVVCWLIFRRSGDPALRMLALAPTTILVVPYALDYDFALLLAPGTLLLLEAMRSGLRPARLALTTLIFALPVPVLMMGLLDLPQTGALLAIALLAIAALAAFRGAAGPWSTAPA